MPQISRPQHPNSCAVYVPRLDDRRYGVKSHQSPIAPTPANSFPRHRNTPRRSHSEGRRSQARRRPHPQSAAERQRIANHRPVRPGMPTDQVRSIIILIAQSRPAPCRPPGPTCSSLHGLDHLATAQTGQMPRNPGGTSWQAKPVTLSPACARSHPRSGRPH